MRQGDAADERVTDGERATSSSPAGAAARVAAARRARWGATSVAVLVGIALLSQSPSVARGYRLLQSSQGEVLRWHDEQVACVLAGELDGVRPQDFELALRGAAQVWSEVPGVELRLSFDGRIDDREAEAALGYDRERPELNRNLVTVANREWEHGPEVHAMSTVSYLASSGRILDVDIRLDGCTSSWSTGGAAGSLDLQSVLTHELGHLLGLGHSADHPAATMYPYVSEGEQNKRTLEPDDEAGLLALYGGYPLEDLPLSADEDGDYRWNEIEPAAPDKHSEGPAEVRLRCGVSSARGGEQACSGSTGLAALLLLALLGGRVRRSRSRPLRRVSEGCAAERLIARKTAPERQ